MVHNYPVNDLILSAACTQFPLVECALFKHIINILNVVDVMPDFKIFLGYCTHIEVLF